MVRWRPRAYAAVEGGGYSVGYSVARLQSGHLDANYRRARRTGDLGSSRALSTIVRASGCASLLLYVLLYRTDAYLPGQLDRTLIDFALSSGVGLFVPKSSRGVGCQGYGLPDQATTVRWRPLASAVVGGHCYSLGYSVDLGAGR